MRLRRNRGITRAKYCSTCKPSQIYCITRIQAGSLVFRVTSIHKAPALPLSYRVVVVVVVCCCCCCFRCCLGAGCVRAACGDGRREMRAKLILHSECASHECLALRPPPSRKGFFKACVGHERNRTSAVAHFCFVCNSVRWRDHNALCGAL